MQTLISLKDAGRVDNLYVPKRKSAGLAWLLSLVLPGAGHLYLGLYVRGILVLGTSLLGLFVLISAIASRTAGGDPLVASLVGIMPVLWVFGFMDAYMTAVEANRGIDPTLVDNPRIAAVLNLTTRGFGYFYLGERTKGFVLFVVMSIAPYFLLALPTRVAAALSILILAFTAWISFDAYRIGRRAFNAQVATMDLPEAPRGSRLPIAVPLVFAVGAGLVLAGLTIAGSVMGLVFPPQP